MTNNLIDILDNILLTKNKIDISKYLNISMSTLNRWQELNSIPPQYEFELLKLNNVNIDYSLYDYKRKDQFFTSRTTSQLCFDTFKNKLIELGDNNEYIYIEPSAGNGAFLNILPDNSIGLDIEPQHERIIKKDYFDWQPVDNQKKYIVFGNPPFGLRGHLALKFINHSSKFADYVCFILPQLFESDGKGNPKKRVKEYNLIHSQKISNEFYSPSNEYIKVNCIFQIWSKKYNTQPLVTNIINDDIQIYSLSNGNTSSQIRNKKMLNKCNIYLPSTCFTKEQMKYYNSFNELPNKRGYGLVFKNNKESYLNKARNINWDEKAFLSTNSSYNIRTNLIINALSE